MPDLPPHHIYVAAEIICAAITIAAIILCYEAFGSNRRRRK